MLLADLQYKNHNTFFQFSRSQKQVLATYFSQIIQKYIITTYRSKEKIKNYQHILEPQLIASWFSLFPG